MTMGINEYDIKANILLKFAVPFQYLLRLKKIQEKKKQKDTTIKILKNALINISVNRIQLCVTPMNQ
jgi:hypothetical protein